LWYLSQKIDLGLFVLLKNNDNNTEKSSFN
jgi:hypothetical protein